MEYKQHKHQSSHFWLILARFGLVVDLIFFGMLVNQKYSPTFLDRCPAFLDIKFCFFFDLFLFVFIGLFQFPALNPYCGRNTPIHNDLLVYTII